MFFLLNILYLTMSFIPCHGKQTMGLAQISGTMIVKALCELN